ncbi:LysR family transcriptional regulator [Undibacterium sp. Di27W]|uniref:LysR family transcriptional regulator n=1 Tax=Undibacterium sp. Di27W TaxID=3413036 RepID=UPI003BF33741
MNNLTLHQLRCFDAVVNHGSFQAAADQLFRSQPTVFAAIKSLETQVGVSLLDRSSYRVKLTDAGRSFYGHARVLLQEYEKLEDHITQLSMGVEAELHVVIGDLSPLTETLSLLRRFFDASPSTRLHLHFEAISGPWERLRDGNADLIFHHIDASDPGLEYIELQNVQLIPVVAPGFLSFPVSDNILPEQMRDYVQCVIRDSATHSKPRDYYLMDGARSWTVSDQLMKKEIIVQGMGWGHMPDYLIEEDLRTQKLLSIKGLHLKGGQVRLVAARNRNIPHGPVAQKLWSYIQDQCQ